MKKIKFDLLYALFLLLILAILKYPALNLPYFWDGLNYMIPAIDYVYQNQITPFLWDFNLGHPPFIFIFIGIMFKIFGNSPVVANSSILLFSFISLFFTYLMGKNLFNRKIGVIASLLLLFTPVFFSYSGQLALAIPLTAFSVMTVYFALKNKTLFYFISGSLAVLTETTGILILIGILITKFIEKKKLNKQLFYYSLPFLTFLIWIILTKFYYGEFFYPISTSLINFNFKILFNFLIIIKTIFFDQFRWILTSIFLISFINLKKFNKNDLKKLIIYFLISLVLFIILNKLNLLASYLDDYYPNIGGYFELAKSFSILISLLFFIFLLYHKEINEFIREKKHLLLVITPLVIILAMSFIIPTAPRYILFTFPFIYLVFAYSINKISMKHSYLVMILILLLFSFAWTGNRNVTGFILENNMEYVDMIKTHQLAASYIEEKFPNAIVLTGHPQALELQYTYGGYVKKPVNVVTIEPFPGVTGYRKNYTEFLNPSTQREINISKIDLYYYSSQQYPIDKITETAKKLNLTLLEKFEVNNKSTEIYLVNKFI